MAQDIGALLQVPAEQRGIDWLQTSLQSALELELSTLPVYLTARFESAVTLL